MRLLIDAGNTRIKWACVEADQAMPAQLGQLGQWRHNGSLSHDELINAKPDTLPWHALAVQRVIISNVAGEQIRRTLTGLFQPGTVDWFTSQAQLAGLTNLYRDPTQLGTDRFASAIAAHALFPGQAFIVATCGTATTLDAVTAEGHFIGGMILPGLQLMAQALAKNTAQLPSVAGHEARAKAKAHFADHTEAAIVSGCLAAQAGAIEHARHELAIQLNTPPDNVLAIVSGGAAGYITPSLTIPHQFIDNLVLIGLQVISS